MTYSADPLADPKFYRDVTTKRFMAWIVDTILVLVLAVIIVPFTAFTGLFFFPALYAVIDFAYRTITIANRSSTLGMRLAAIELRDATGARLDLGQALLHTTGYYVSWAVFPLQLLSVIFMCAASRGQSLTDLVLGTAAMNRRSLG
ncbi:RDD family protein [Pseudosulfitobacter koreensis]|uniref:RDD family protein n=1 Tax=Pseudosulfitobacter koreensis TaxID=2968472 RepID=A0ABT1YXE0_9RHOB|nr:RDD family protein [Pseudosulfitobacter koreense]MCR8825554.1 RDD family protein [Pseudosulfitobacter koreense]